MCNQDLRDRMARAETAEEIAEICLIEAQRAGGPFYRQPHETGDDRMAAIQRALANGNPELADAIDNDTRCPECGCYVSGDGYTVDPGFCCARCEP